MFLVPKSEFHDGSGVAWTDDRILGDTSCHCTEKEREMDTESIEP